MKLVLKVLATVVVVAVVVVGGLYVWATVRSNNLLSRTFESHTVDFPIPFPLDPDEVAALGLDDDAAAHLAGQRAVERGQHLVQARYGCAECHGANFGGGVMVDAFSLGTILGPNLTEGEGSRTIGYTPADWDRAVRHGILPDGRPSAMPAEDFQLMSDEELSDIVAYIRSLPDVDNTVPAKRLGPLGKILLATGGLPLSADRIESHTATHAVYPPPSEVSVEFGRHLAAICSGCHGENLAGGPIPGGDPSWPPARNITPDPTALGTWTYPQFVATMRGGMRPDGTPLREPMSNMVPYVQQMSDVELEAMWAYLQSVPPVPVTE